MLKVIVKHFVKFLEDTRNKLIRFLCVIWIQELLFLVTIVHQLCPRTCVVCYLLLVRFCVL